MYSALMAVQYTGIVILVLEIIFILFQNSSRIQRDMIFLLFSLLIVFVSYTVEMRSKNVYEAVFAAKFAYLGKPFLGLVMLFLILDYCRIRIPTWLSVILILIEVGFSAIVFTTDRHALFYSSATFHNEGIFPHLDLVRGPFYIAFMTNTLLLCIIIISICIWQLGKLDSHLEKRQIKLFLLMVLAPLIALGIFFTNVFKGYDCTLIGYLLATIGFSVSFFKYDMFDTITLAKEQVVDYIHGGLLVYDNHNQLIYHNKQADEMNITDKIGTISEGEEELVCGDKVYFVENRKIEKFNVVYGNTYFIYDITERYEYERNLEKEKKRADAASEAKSEFLFSMSHDIRTPMNAILGMTKIAGVNLENKEKVSDCLNKIEMSGQHLLELINEILDMNKIEAGQLELYVKPFDLKELLKEVVTIATPLAQSMEHQFVVDVDNITNKAVCGDRSRLSQVLTNILGNAIKYTEKGGEIHFSATENLDKLKIDEDSGSFASFVFTISDNGIGMSEEYLPHIFDSFTRADEDKVKGIQGSGLGMAITKQFVDLMGGDIKVCSKLGEGSTFTVEVALRLQTEEEVELTSEKVSLENFYELDLSSKRVLLVEDYEINAEIAGEILGMVGLSVEFAINGKDAVEKIEGCEDGYYDIVFMDVMMPVMNGYDATKAIRAMDREYAKKVPILAMTANAFEEDIQNAKKAGMNGHIAKPLDMDQLMSLIKEWLM